MDAGGRATQESKPRDAVLGPVAVGRVWTDPDLAAILTIRGLGRGGISWVLLFAVEKKYLARLLEKYYEARKVVACENLSSEWLSL